MKTVVAGSSGAANDSNRRFIYILKIIFNDQILIITEYQDFYKTQSR